ncbi:MAG: acyltransferase [Paracoccaceae bacterium]
MSGWLNGARLGDVCGGRDNNLNLIRMIAALSVLLSHAWPISLGFGVVEPLEGLIDRSLGWAAVAVFFAISGFLISRSFDRKRFLSDWFAARIMRLFPGLLVVTALTAAILGPTVTTLPVSEYFRQPETLTYVPRNLSLAALQYELPGVFANNPYGGAINGSLWTLIHEVLCYFGVLLAGLAGLLRSRRWFLAVFGLYLIAYGLTAPELAGSLLPGRAASFRELSFPFAVGAAAYVWRDKVVLNWPLLIAGLAVVVFSRPTPFFEPVLMTWISYSTFVFAYLPAGLVRRYNRLGDYSYGTYIYAFPAQQLVVHLLGPMQPITNIVLATPAVLICAVLSWHLVEGPALASRGWWAARLRRVSD